MGSWFDTQVTTGVSVPLTTLAAGYKPTGLIGTSVFPIVKSVTKSGKIPIFSSKDAFKIYQTLRARGAKSNRAPISADSWKDFACEEHDIAIPLDNRELEELRAIPGDARLKALFNLQDRQRKRAQWNLAIELEKVIADLVQDTANYPVTNYTTLTTTSCWSESGSTPIDDIETAKNVVRSLTGVYPNAMVMGIEAWDQLKFHAQYTNLLKYTERKIVTEDIIAAIHNFKEVKIGLSLTVDSDEAFYDMWGDNVIIYYKPSGETPDIDEPGFGYTIRPAFSAKPYPYVDIFQEEGGKIVNVRCTDFWGHVFVMPAAGYLIKNIKR